MPGLQLPSLESGAEATAVQTLRDETSDLEVFTRTLEGEVRLASNRTVDAHKKQMSAVAEFFGEMPDLDDYDEKFRAAKKKIEDAEKEKDE